MRLMEGMSWVVLGSPIHEVCDQSTSRYIHLRNDKDNDQWDLTLRTAFHRSGLPSVKCSTL